MQPGAPEAAEVEEQHRVAACEQNDDTGPYPRKEATEHAPPQRKPYRWLERTGRGAQYHVREEHAADPDHGGKNVQRDEQCHAARLHPPKPGCDQLDDRCLAYRDAKHRSGLFARCYSPSVCVIADSGRNRRAISTRLLSSPLSTGGAASTGAELSFARAS